MSEGEEEEGQFEEWDADFLDQLIQVEELAISSSSSSLPNPNTSSVPSQPAAAAACFSHLPLLPPLQQQQQQQHGQNHLNSADNLISYSPPRHLSQRPPDALLHSAKDQEIERLKKELGHASKRLTDLERECSELKKERNKIRYSNSHAQEKQAAVPCPKNANLKHGVRTVDTHGISQHHRNSKFALEGQIGHPIDIASCSKAIGVQTDKVGDFSTRHSNNEFPCVDLPEKLLEIWGSTSGHVARRNLISKLFVACPADFHVLFGCMKMDGLSKAQMHLFSSESFSLQHHMHSFPTSEAAKVSHLYFVMIEINNGLLQLEALFGALLDLCRLKNVAILSSSLRVLHVFLKHLLTCGRISEGRNNVKVEGICSRNNNEAIELFCVGRDEEPDAGCIPSGIRELDTKTSCKKGRWNHDISLLLSSVDWFSLFDMMHQIAVGNADECVKLEAVSIMNLILMRSNAYMERELFGKALIFESIPQFLKKDAGSHLKKEALCLLHFLLNCPILLRTFCSGSEETADSENGEKNASTLKGFTGILQGLADSIACLGNSIQNDLIGGNAPILKIYAALLSPFSNCVVEEEDKLCGKCYCSIDCLETTGQLVVSDMELRKRAITVLAYLASSGKSGFEILVSHKFPGDTNFLLLILQALVAEMDVEVSALMEPAETVKARTLFMREALILLNRLVSNPAYSSTVLRLLTASRDIAGLTVDVASRLSQRDHRLRQPDSLTRQMRESEIIDLAQVFKKRVFAYLGDKIS